MAFVRAGSILLILLASPRVEVTLYDEDPRHLWNRLHAALFVRTAPDGSIWGQDRIDPFMCRSYVGEQEKAVLEILDEFLEKGGESKVADPMKRAILQRDLWAAFEGAVWHEKQWHPSDELRRYLAALQPRLVKAVRKLALPAEEIAKLADPYARAVEAKKIATAYDPAKSEQPFLPPDLLTAGGPWICVTSERDPGPFAGNHQIMFRGRSVFLILLRHPDGREKGEALLKEINEKGKDAKDVSHVQLPPLPRGAILALVRRMVLPDDAGRLVVTPVTESIQLRVHLGPEKAKDRMQGTQYTFPQDVFQFALSRAGLFREPAEGLRATGSEEKEVAGDLFNRRHVDFVEGEVKDHSDRPGAIRNGAVVTHRVLQSCAGCHTYPTWSNQDWSMTGVWSIGRGHQNGSALPLASGSLADESERTLRWKRNQEDWSALLKLWK